MPLKAILFDFDGTLVDSDPAHLVAFNEVLAPYGCSLTAQQYATTVVGRANVTIFGNLFPDAPLAELEWLGEEKERAYLRRADLVALHDGAIEVLTELRAQGLQLALVTNAPRMVIDDVAVRLGLLEYFDATITIDDVTHGKPHPEPYLQALAQLGVSANQAIVVEDSAPGLRAAQAAGMDVLLLGGSASLDANEHRTSVYSIDSLRRIPDFVANQAREQLA